jgi:hypothetical protein
MRQYAMDLGNEVSELAIKSFTDFLKKKQRWKPPFPEKSFLNLSLGAMNGLFGCQDEIGESL